jgi:hypothetical protein
VPDCSTDGFAESCSHARRGSASRETTRLEQDDAGPAQPLHVEECEWKTRRLAGAGRRAQDRDALDGERGRDVIDHIIYGERRIQFGSDIRRSSFWLREYITLQHPMRGEGMAETGKPESGNKLGSMALKIGIASAIGFGAIATGLFVSRRGRHLVKEAWQGRERTRLEDRVLDLIWGDPVLGRRDIDVDELDAGVVAIFGEVRTDQERRVALAIARDVKGITEVQDHLRVVPRQSRRIGRRPV